MKEKRPHKEDDASVIILTQQYRKIGAKLKEIILAPSKVPIRTAEYMAEKQITSAEKILVKANANFANSLLSARELGERRADTQAKNNGLDMPPTGDSGEAYKVVKTANYAYLELNKGLSMATANLRQGMREVLHELGDRNRNLSEYTSAIKNKLSQADILEIKYSNGRKTSLTNYAKMLSRSSRIETANIGAINRAQELGTDLVKCTTITPTCKLCSEYQGRVYSVSGKDKRYPALYETALSKGYSLMHPNCRHEFLPYFEELVTSGEKAKDIAYSNRKFSSPNELKEKKDSVLYAKWQTGNRQRYDEEIEYTRMKATLGAQMPYSTLGGYRRARREYNAIKNGKSIDKERKLEYNNYKEVKLSYKDKTLQQDIIHKFPKQIEAGKQGKHIVGHNNYIEGKSKINIPLEEAQQLVDTYAGTGEIKRARDGKWTRKEKIILDRIIGSAEDNAGIWVETNKIMIHYSKKGTHIVPTIN